MTVKEKPAWTRGCPGARVGADRGQSLVELALTLPIMTVLLMGILDLSFVLYAHIQVAAAAGQGARAASLFPGDITLSLAQNDASREAFVEKAIYDSGTGRTAMGRLKTSSPSFAVAGDVWVSFPNGDPVDPANTCRTGEEVVVTVRYRQPLRFSILPSSLPDSLELSSSSRIRIQ